MAKLSLPVTIQKFLENHALASFATVDENRIPNLSFVYYVSNRDNTHLYFLMKKDSRKIRNILANPRVAIAIVEHANLETLQLAGIAAVVVDEKMLHKIFDIYAMVANAQHAESFPPVTKLSGDWTVAVDVTLTWYRYSQFISNPPIILESKHPTNKA